ncbi:hypothetical protein ABK040_007458 [Willaertia magna]
MSTEQDVTFSVKNEEVSYSFKKSFSSYLNLIFASIGWLTFSIVFNVLNTIVYSALYPMILNDAASKESYSTAFSITNTVTTLASAICLPVLGSILDHLHIIKPSLLITQYIGILSTIALFFSDKIPPQSSTAHLAILEIIYIVAMFFLRVSVMNNNALLPCFESKHIIVLSLLGNFIGFGVNLIGLLILAFTPKAVFSDNLWGITRANWWVLIFTSFVIVISVFVWFSPNGIDKITLSKENKNENTSLLNNEHSVIENNESINGVEVKQRFDIKTKLSNVLKVFKESISSFVETLKNWKSNESYYNCGLFLIAYLFFSTAGTVVTVFLAPLFIDIYDFTLEQEVLLNLYFKIAMVGGVIGGVIIEKLFKPNDILMLVLQNIIFGALCLSIFITISLKVAKTVVLFQFLAIGFFYAWNTSVARGCMSKLIPLEKKCEFMGFYSAFTYLGISITSGIYALLSYAKLPSHTLLLILFIWLIPAYLLLAILRKSLNKKEQREK